VDERTAFLATICAAPDADAPRLVFADWLDEHGDIDRATFIRLQCQLARADSLAAQRAVRHQEQELFAHHHARWLGELPKLDGVWFDTFQRGFVAGANFVSFDAWLRHAETVFTASPIHTVSVQLTQPSVPRFVGSPWLARLTTLKLERSNLDDAGMAALALSPYLVGVRTLRLAHNLITNGGARSLAGRCCLMNLVDLDLSNNLIGSIGAQALIDAPHLQQLHRLRLTGNRIPPVMAARLRYRFGVRVEVEG
jgi:uncharacterized protein (TIGR02996 family)